MSGSGDQIRSPNAGVEVPERVRAKVAALGAEGERWVRDLPGLLADLAEEWAIAVDGPPLAGGTGSYLVETVWEGRPAVLKVALPDGVVGNTEFVQEVRATQAGRYLELFRVDLDRRVVLMERLGRPLSALGWSVEQQIEVLAPTLAASWRRLSDDEAAVLPTGAEKAAFLADCIEEWWESTGRPCARSTVADALECTAHRRAAFDPDAAVLVHGDAHANNVLEAVAGDPSQGFRLIDPEGIVSEPAHDLAIPLRGWHDAGRLSGWCAAMASAAGIDTLPVWEWAFAERVSSGLFLLHLGLADEGRDFLAVADRLASAR